ncbi:alpha/beta hydrolase [Bradyrhizobium sp. Tv2a-2]|uniref:alpha/beta fold hydrolase n=1 Tax=Bradyrhizobium sp. Tv2a-2 TaxID=113395 RepID=UPI00040CE444|nr:alpha/beta hydrolase [Bradyrhizobium sp. Tv2a-2]
MSAASTQITLASDLSSRTANDGTRPELRTVSTGLLDIGYEISGPATGRPVILLHGWPDDVRTWDRVLAPLHATGLRTIVPYLRGFGSTRFRNKETFRSGQLSALGRDVLDLADAIGLEHYSVVGHDWGARAAYIASFLAPERITHCAALSVGWGTNNPDQILSLRQVHNYWYHWYIALDRGADLVRNDRLNFTRYIWQIWNPSWSISDEEFAATAASFMNADWAEIVLHSYRVRWGLAASDSAYDDIEHQLAQGSEIRVPTLVIHGGADPCNHLSTSEGKEQFFTSSYRRIVLDGAGHFPQRDAAGPVAEALIAFLSGT